jgi:hypothetical protein
MNTQPTAATDTVCNPEFFKFPAVKKRLVTGSFTGGDVTSDGGLPLVRQLDRRLGPTKAMAQVLPAPRDPALTEHSRHSLLRQRLHGLGHGDEDLNDHDPLRHDPAWQPAIEQIKPLASRPTLCRLENRADRATAWALHGILVGQFVNSFPTPPTELILDFDATDDRVHGRQEGAHFHGWRGGVAQQAAHPTPLEPQLSLSTALRSGGPGIGQRLNSTERCPGTLKNNGGWGCFVHAWKNHPL